MTEPIKLLDHGFVRLIDHMGGDLSVVRSARVSYDADWRTGEDEGKDAKLIDYLVRNRHTSPFEAVTFTFEVKAPIFVLRQWHRHRTWCLAGDTQLEFVRPCDGKPYKRSISQVEASWSPKEAKRRRGGLSELPLQEYNRKRISGMKLRCMEANGSITETSIVDVWKSGVKKVFRVTAGGRSIRASADHLFHSDGDWVKVADLSGRNVTLLHKGGTPVAQKFPDLTPEDLACEKWNEFADGYRVSSLGRVQTKWGQGARKKSAEWKLKTQTVSNKGRAVVSLAGKGAVQVSRLVAEAFVEGSGGMVLHADDNALDNRAGNLYWGGNEENQRDSARNGSRATRSWVSVPVESIIEEGEETVYDLTVDHPEHNFVANNFLVHNCFNEISARYAELPEEFYVPELDQITTQSSSNKQMRTTEQHPAAAMAQRLIREQNASSFERYKVLIDGGVPRELARTVLPVGTYSHMFATVNLLNLMKFCGLRLHEHAQYEIRVYAQAMLDLIEPLVPVSVASFKKHSL